MTPVKQPRTHARTRAHTRAHARTRAHTRAHAHILAHTRFRTHAYRKCHVPFCPRHAVNTLSQQEPSRRHFDTMTNIVRCHCDGMHRWQSVPSRQWRRRSFYETHLYCLHRRKRTMTDWHRVFSQMILQNDHITLDTNHLRAPRNVYSRKNQHSLRRRGAKLRPYKQIRHIAGKIRVLRASFITFRQSHEH